MSSNLLGVPLSVLVEYSGYNYMNWFPWVVPLKPAQYMIGGGPCRLGYLINHACSYSSAVTVNCTKFVYMQWIKIMYILT
jgi:hypothetical protein